MSFDPEAYVSDFDPDTYLDSGDSLSPVSILEPSPREFPEMDSTSLAEITVADWMERQHKIPFNEGLRGYKAYSNELGLSGNPEADYKELKQRQELSMVAVKRMPKLSQRLQKAKELGDNAVDDLIYVYCDRKEKKKRN